MSDAEIKISWDIGSSYDFFASLIVLHDPGLFGLRPSWAAGVRSRLQPNDRQLLEDLLPTMGVPIEWILSSAALREASAALSALQQIPAIERLTHLTLALHLDKSFQQRLNAIAEAGKWQTEDLEALKAVYSPYKLPKERFLKKCLEAWATAHETGERLVRALQAYYQVFFAEEEKHVQPLLYQGLVQAQEQSAKMSLTGLMDTLSQGVHLSLPADISEVIFIPSIWITPLVIIRRLQDNRLGFLFGARPANVSLVPGDVIPDGMLRVLKALADPTRLRMLRYLAEQTFTLAELSRKLRLRPPTVLHHLSILRLAGLVHIVLQESGERRYSLRREGIPVTFDNLEQFLRVGESQVLPRE
jgi:DNA-binding transcriptional ArsR family regulator